MTEIPRRKHTAVLDELVPLAGKHALDVGCGNGSLVRAMTRRGAQVTGAEVQPARLTAARAHDPAGTETYLLDAAQALPLPDESFDVVVFFNSLHHVPEAEMPAALDEAARVLRPGGLLYVAEPLAEGALHELALPIDDETHVRACADAALRAAAAGPVFEMVAETFYDAPLVYRSFAEMRAELETVDPRRRAQVQAKEAELAAAFDRLGESVADGVLFHQPMRVNLLRRPA